MDNKNLLVLNQAYLAKAGIELSNKPDAAAKARASLIAANGGKGYIAQNAAADTVIQIMDYARRELANGENSMKQVCIALASVDMAKGYELATDASGKTYSSMLAFSMDTLPHLAKSTVAGYLSVGRNIYVPAINKRFGASSSILLELPPSTLDAVKANLSDDSTRGNTIEALKAASKKGKVTQRLAKGIAKVTRDAVKNDTAKNVTATEIVKAAMGDANALKAVYGEIPEKRTGGATANGGNTVDKSANTDEYNAIKARLAGYIATERGENGGNLKIAITDYEGLSGFLKRAMVSNNEGDAKTAIRALIEIIG